MLKQVIAAYTEAIVDTDRHKALAVVYDAVNKGISPEDVLFKVVIPSLESMVKSISESFDANLAQHFMASQIAAEVTEKLIPKFERAPESVGRIVIGTSMGDYHGLGKRIVIGCLRSYMIDAVDLGLNVPPERFVDEAVAHRAQVIGISSMMVHTARGEQGCLKVRKILQQRRLEDHIKIIVGGAPYRFDHDLSRVVQADAWAEDGIKSGPVVAQLIQEVKP
jgi:methanogenic corrinoid protein MtbC1